MIKSKLVNISANKDTVFISADLPNQTVVIYQINSNKTVIRDSTKVLQDGHIDKTINSKVETDFSVSVTWKDPADAKQVNAVNKRFIWPKTSNASRTENFKK